MAAPLPWVVGPWVRGERFHGRADLLARLESSAPGLQWLAGGRRIGKTSVLRELERRAITDPHGPVPLVLDLQGVESPADLDLAVADAFSDLEPAAARRLGSGPPLESMPASAALATTAGGALRHRARLLVLVDEAEALGAVATTDPVAAAAFGAALTAGGNVSTVVASSVRLEAVARRTPGLSWLAPAMAAATWIGPLADDEVADLLTQRRLPPEHRPAWPGGGPSRVAALAGGHPFLLQLLAKRVTEADDLAAAERSIDCEPAVRSLVEIDLRLLSELDRATVSAVVLGESVSAAGERLGMLVAMGLLSRTDTGRLTPGNAAVARWG